MATTPNFNWSTPDNTGLVKNGALDIRTLGDSIDASMADLKGGTTGQVLSKASGTDMDFTWVAQDDSNAIQNAIVDAKGDLIAATAADTPARLAVGTNGQVLTADSTAATGLAWAAPASGYADNCVLNSSFQVWQRGTSINASAFNTYTADRWTAGRGGAAFTVSRQLTGDTTNLPFIQYCARVQRDSGNTNTDNGFLLQNVETINSIPYAGRTITYSFYARRGANFSAVSNALGVTLTTGTGTDQSAFVSISGSNNVINTTATLTTTWQRFTYTVAIASTVTQLFPTFVFSPTGTAGAADFFEVTGVMLEVGSTASAFHTNQPTIQAELAACQRYYVRITAGADNYVPITPIGGAVSTTSVTLTLQPPTTLRAAASSIEFANLSVYGGGTSGFGFLSVSSLAMIRSSNSMLELSATVTGATTGAFYRVQPNNQAGYIGVVAEL